MDPPLRGEEHEDDECSDRLFCRCLNKIPGFEGVWFKLTESSSEMFVT